MWEFPQLFLKKEHIKFFHESKIAQVIHVKNGDKNFLKFFFQVLEIKIRKKLSYMTLMQMQFSSL